MNILHSSDNLLFDCITMQFLVSSGFHSHIHKKFVRQMPIAQLHKLYRSLSKKKKEERLMIFMWLRFFSSFFFFYLTAIQMMILINCFCRHMHSQTKTHSPNIMHIYCLDWRKCVFCFTYFACFSLHKVGLWFVDCYLYEIRTYFLLENVFFLCSFVLKFMRSSLVVN